MPLWFNVALPIWGFADTVEEFRRAAAELAPDSDVRVLPRGGTVEFSDGEKLR